MGLPLRIEHKFGVAAPPAVAWEVLSGLEGWKDWNPLYTEASGRLGIGEILTLTLKLPDGKPETIRPTVVDWVPEMQLIWRLKLSGGLLRTTRFFEIEALDDGRACIIYHGEMFEGLASNFIPKSLRRQIRKGFHQMSDALQAEILRRNAA
jgi:hypothetical protein